SGYRNNSPVYFAREMKGDYLLVHGMGDDNVHFQNTAEMANALIQANKQFETYFYPNRNHGIYGGPTRLHLYTKMTDFLDRKLKGDDGYAAEKSKNVVKSLKGQKMLKE
ncbi:MAG: S9 family peptidase, partial [Saprospiraceae bacterium]|nr:S9 family peptidase [Saprospiraceae bacterium]